MPPSWATLCRNVPLTLVFVSALGVAAELLEDALRLAGLKVARGDTVRLHRIYTVIGWIHHR